MGDLQEMWAGEGKLHLVSCCSARDEAGGLDFGLGDFLCSKYRPVSQTTSCCLRNVGLSAAFPAHHCVPP